MILKQDNANLTTQTIGSTASNSCSSSLNFASSFIYYECTIFRRSCVRRRLRQTVVLASYTSLSFTSWKREIIFCISHLARQVNIWLHKYCISLSSLLTTRHQEPYEYLYERISNKHLYHRKLNLIGDTNQHWHKNCIVGKKISYEIY